MGKGDGRRVGGLGADAKDGVRIGRVLPSPPPVVLGKGVVMRIHRSYV